MVHSSDSSVLFVLPFLIHFQLQLREHMEQILEDSYTGMTMWVGLNLFACYFHIFNTFFASHQSYPVYPTLWMHQEAFTPQGLQRHPCW